MLAYMLMIICLVGMVLTVYFFKYERERAQGISISTCYG